MRLWNHQLIPMWVIKLRNACVDVYIKLMCPPVPTQTFKTGLNEKGYLVVPERYGPDYPQCLLDLSRLYRRHHERIGPELLLAAGRERDEFRGLVHLAGVAENVHVMEFAYARSTVFVLFHAPCDSKKDREVTVRIRIHPISLVDLYELIGGIDRFLEEAMEPFESVLKIGGSPQVVAAE